MLYVDPYSVSNMADKINLLMGEKKLQKELIQKGFENIKRFDWEKTAKETMNVIESVIGQS